MADLISYAQQNSSNLVNSPSIHSNTQKTTDSKMRFLDYKETNTSFAGSDMLCSIRISLPSKDSGKSESYTLVIGELQTISYSIHTDKYPIRSLGTVNAKTFTQGPRTIAGSLVFSVFDKHFYQRILEVAEKSGGYVSGKHPLMDELPPFDVTISFANEYGAKAHMTIYGITIVDEGQVMSMNDIYTENTYQYMANDIEYMTDQDITYRDEEETYNFIALNDKKTDASSYKPIASYEEEEEDKEDDKEDDKESDTKEDDNKDVDVEADNNVITVQDALNQGITQEHN